MQNKIFIEKNRNAYLGAHASHCLFHGQKMIKELTGYTGKNRFFVIEFSEGEYKLRAANSKIEEAEKYMKENRILVIKSECTP